MNLIISLFAFLSFAWAQDSDPKLNAKIAHIYYSVNNLENLEWEGDPAAGLKQAAAVKAELDAIRPDLKTRSPGIIGRAEEAINLTIKKADYQAAYLVRLKSGEAQLKTEEPRKAVVRSNTDPTAKILTCLQELHNNAHQSGRPLTKNAYYYAENDDAFISGRYRGEEGLFVVNSTGFNFVSTRKARKECSFEMAKKNVILIQTAGLNAEHSWKFTEIYDEKDGLVVASHAMRADVLVPGGSSVSPCNLEQTRSLDSDAKPALRAAIIEAVRAQKSLFQERLAKVPEEIEVAARGNYTMPTKPNVANFQLALKACESLDPAIDNATYAELKSFSQTSMATTPDSATH